MGKETIHFPVKHIDGNLVFSHDGSVTAYFHIAGFNYDFLDPTDKFIPFQQQNSFLFNNKYDLHYILEPVPTNVEQIIDETIEDIEMKKYPLKQNGIKYMNMMKDALLKRKKVQESNETQNYIGVQLNQDNKRYKEHNVGKNVISSFKEFIKGLNNQVNRATGLEANDILESEIVYWHEQSEQVKSEIQSAFNCPVSPVTTAETVYLTEKEFSVLSSKEDIQLRPDFISGRTVEGTDDEGRSQRAVRPTEKAFIDLQGTNIEEVDPTTLKFSKQIDDDVQELYTKYLVVAEMNSENWFPSFEWLYNIQSSLPFPISVSIRSYHQENDHITKRLSNKRLEYQDQREEMGKGSAGQDLNLDMSEAGTIQAENYFTKTGQPAYVSSIIFKISHEDKKELNVRSRQLKDELTRYGIQVENPFGEQLTLMQERILGGKKQNSDYRIESDCGVLAGMMFGATTNIGDNRGFYIGHTLKGEKPVFIKPDLAAKGYDDVKNVVDSISQMYAGMTGKGKSFAMNLSTYLSVLYGSIGLVIDPKGDRSGWDKLPMIPSEYINKWTLGETDDDAGCLDPFRTSVDLDDGKSISQDIMSYLANISIQDNEYAVLGEKIQQVGKEADPCIGEVIKRIEDEHKNPPETSSETRRLAVEKLFNVFTTLKQERLSNLLIGERGQAYKTLSVNAPLQILMVQNLNLPDKETKTLRVSHKISEAILISITSFTKQFMLSSDRGQHKVILQDEASSIDASPVGRELMDFIVRKGRYFNTTLIKGSQNASDHGNDVANMGMKFSFGLRTNEECREMLEFLNLPTTKGNIQKLKTLQKGNCLFQDIYGRTAIIRINPIFNELFDAFDTSTATEEEKEIEEQRQQKHKGVQPSQEQPAEENEAEDDFEKVEAQGG